MKIRQKLRCFFGMHEQGKEKIEDITLSKNKEFKVNAPAKVIRCIHCDKMVKIDIL